MVVLQLESTNRHLDKTNIDETDTQTIINHNPLPDITHEEFVSLLGPILIPENYAHLYSSPSESPTITPPIPGTPTNSNAPFEWLHFEGRSIKTTMSNMIGVDGLARERKWRHQCVFSLDVGRKTRQGVQAVRSHLSSSHISPLSFDSLADAVRRHNIFQHSLCKCPFACVCCDSANLSFIPRSFAVSPLSCSTSRLLGKQARCCSSVSSDQRIFPELWLGTSTCQSWKTHVLHRRRL